MLIANNKGVKKMNEQEIWEQLARLMERFMFEQLKFSIEDIEIIADQCSEPMCSDEEYFTQVYISTMSYLHHIQRKYGKKETTLQDEQQM